ncbi:MAG: caspase family protein [Microthrixaceae bacterium]
MSAVVLGALLVAAVPGLIGLAPAPRDLERAAIASLDRADERASARPPASAPVEVAITPPPAVLSGALAPVGAPAGSFTAAGGTGTGVFALVIGVNDYPGSRSDLRSAVADADTIDAALRGFGVPASHRVVLRDGQARRAEVVSAIRSLVASAGPDSTVVFAYAGHVRKLDRDTEAMVTADGGLISDAELASLLAPSPARRMWLLMATCYAGGFTEALEPGRILTGAADAGSLAYENSAINGSYLVHYLVREGWLDGRAGRSVQEAYAYAAERMRAEGAKGRPYEADFAGTPLVLGSGDPSGGSSAAPNREPPPSSPPPDQSPSNPPPPSPTTTAPPKQTCTLGLVCRRS